MIVDLAYGATGLEVELPDDTVVVTPHHHRAAEDARAEMRRALAEPVAGPRLVDLVGPDDTVAIAICDATRPQPRALVVGALLDELAGIVTPEQVTVVVATGTHRVSTEAEKVAMLGADLLDKVRVVDHDCRDRTSLVSLGTAGDGVPVQLARAFCEASVRISTGLVEPHFFAGFSGGPKMVAPGLAGERTVHVLHDARRIGDPRATFGVREGNPVHDDVRAIAAIAGVDFSVDVVLDADQRLVRAFAGELFATHDAACELARESAMARVEERFDMVVTTNSGWPMDQDLYQSVKGIAAACEVVRPGGLVVLAAECREGFPAHGNFHHLLSSAPSPEQLMAALAAHEETAQDQWQAQVLARCLQRARVLVRTDGLSPAELASVHLSATADVAGALAGERRRRAGELSCCALPEGPRTIPYVAA